jgi:hypothetical protein
MNSSIAKRTVTNFHWFEYLEKKDEELRAIENELRNKQMLLEWLEFEEKGVAEAKDLKKRLAILLNSCADFRSKHVNRIDKQAKNPIVPEDYLTLDRWLDYFNRGTATLSLAINQRLEGISLFDFTSHFPYENPSTGFQKTHNASNYLLSSYFELVYGKKWLSDSAEPAPLVVFSQDIYRVFPDLRVAVIPIADKYRYRFWIGIGHETFHEKMGSLFQLLPKLTDNPSQSLSELKKISKKSSLEELQSIRAMINNLNTDISKLYNYAEDSPGALAYFRESTIIEFFCDFASLLLSGPAVFFMLASSWADTYKHLPHGSKIHCEDLRHPPQYVRLKCMTEVLKSSKLNYEKDIVNCWVSRMDELKGFDSYDKDVAELYDEYSKKITEKYLTNILDVIDSLIFENKYYTAERWNKAKEIYHYLSTEGSIPEGVGAIDLLNIAWIKREESFDMLKKCNSIQVFKEWHLNERKLFEEVMCYLSDCYSKTKVN